MTYATAEQKLARIPEQYLDEVCHYLDDLARRIKVLPLSRTILIW